MISMLLCIKLVLYFCYLYYGSPFFPIFYYCCLLDLTKIHSYLFLLGEFIQGSNFSIQTSGLIRHSVVTILPRCIWVFNDLTSEESRHSVLANLLCWLGVNLVIGQWFNHTLSVIYFTNMHSGFSQFHQCINQTLCVS